MRAVLLIIMSLWFPGTALACCDDFSRVASRPLTVPSAVGERAFSSFRGISLGSSPGEVVVIATTLGFTTDASTYVGDDSAISAIDICSDGYAIGHADFDRAGQMVRLTLRDSFFAEAPAPVQTFAAGIFKRYRVRTTRVADDVCFQDVTCFRGLSRAGEQFLIMRFGTVAELYVRRDASKDASD